MFEFKDDLEIILKTLDMSLRDFADELYFDAPTVSNWLTGKKMPDRRSKEDVYSYAFDNRVYINRAHEEPLYNLSKKQGFTLLFHGSRRGLNGDIDIAMSKINNDFGRGFYMGETLEQSATFVSEADDPKVYGFGIYTDGLNVVKHEINLDWMLSIAYYRGKLDEYKSSEKLKKIININDGADLIIAPITDNRMFDIIDEFIEGRITDVACMNALAALDLGNQYVLKTKKAISKLGMIREFYLCNSEKEHYRKRRNELNGERSKRIKSFRSQYREGSYIEDIL